jgi:hypothetical protein
MSNVFSPPSPENGNRSSFRNVVFLFPRIPYDGKSPKTPVILYAYSSLGHMKFLNIFKKFSHYSTKHSYWYKVNHTTDSSLEQ